jgi:Fe-Mn family superoxide dismutase
MELTRREALGIVGGTVAMLAVDPTPSQASGTAAEEKVVPLPFDPKKLKGISEKLIVSHHDKNYAGAVKNLNRVNEELARTSKDTPPFVVGGLMQSALTFTNSKILHEHYFGNLGGDGKRDGAIAKALADQFGTIARWEEVFRSTGMGLSGGSGWVVLAHDLPGGVLRTCWSGNHTQTLAGGYPLLVMDMYEHAYQMDHGADAAKYIDAFFANLDWGAVNARFERSRKAATALHG